MANIVLSWNSSVGTNWNTEKSLGFRDQQWQTQRRAENQPCGLCLDNELTTYNNFISEWGSVKLLFTHRISCLVVNKMLTPSSTGWELSDGGFFWGEGGGGHTNLFIRCVSQFKAKDWLLQPTHVPWPLDCWLFWGGCSPSPPPVKSTEKLLASLQSRYVVGLFLYFEMFHKWYSHFLPVSKLLLLIIKLQNNLFFQCEKRKQPQLSMSLEKILPSSTHPMCYRGQCAQGGEHSVL